MRKFSRGDTIAFATFVATAIGVAIAVYSARSSDEAALSGDLQKAGGINGTVQSTVGEKSPIINKTNGTVTIGY